MVRIRNIQLLLGAMIACAAAPGRKVPDPAADTWKFAAENYGVQFYWHIVNECRPSGAVVSVKLVNTLENPVSISFRVNDPNWTRSFAKELGAGEKNTDIKFFPEDGTACHAFIDQVYLETKKAQASNGARSKDDGIAAN